MPLLLLLLLGGTIAAGIALSRKTVPAELTASMQVMLSRYAVQGPRGEWVFKPDVALGIVRTLAAQTYTFDSQSDPTRIKINPVPSGAPPSADLSALGWARTQNSQLTIMAPVYMAESSSADRFLQAAPPGQESQQPQLYCVLAYPGVLAAGTPPPGSPAPAVPGATPTIVPVPLAAAAAEVPSDLMALYTQLLQNGTDPNLMNSVAAELDAVGMHTAAELLRKAAASLSAVSPAPVVIGPGGLPPPPPPPPGPSVVQQAVQQAAAIVSSMTPLQKAAAAMNLLLNQHGYKQADQPIYKAFQQAAGLGADGFPGSGTMGKLISVLNSMGVQVAPVKVYPWHSAGGYDGVNAPTQAEWDGAIVAPPGASTYLDPGGSTWKKPGGATAIQNALNALQGSTNMQPASDTPFAPPGASPVQLAAVAMNNALAANGYRQSDQPLYRAFQSAAGTTSDGYPGTGTMGKLKSTLSTMGMSLAAVPIYPWRSTGGYDGVNAPTAAQWNQ